MFCLSTMRRLLVAVGISVFVLGYAALVLGGEATLHRDTWGVPHIVAQTEEEGMFALGYAQAEDRLEDIYLAIRTGVGRMAEIQGNDLLQQDYMMRLTHNDTLHPAYLKTAPEQLRKNLIAFTAGIQKYIDEHPGEASSVAIPVEPWHPLAVARAMILRWPLGTIMGDLGNAPERVKPAMGSNQWAISPKRSADGSAILLSDPHLTWEGLAVLYEARFHGGDLQMNGYYLIGSPMLAIGHNKSVGWALTTGGPDTSDVYKIKFRVQPELQYEYDSEWKPIRVETYQIPVKGGDAVSKKGYFTHLGPVVSEPDLKTGVAYVGASPYLDQTGLYDQFYKMAKTTNVREFNKVLGEHQYNEQNVMSADTMGNISYVRNGATPIRASGYDWSRPVDGTTSATAWKGIHPQSDLVHIINPECGYMQNCNISPANMMANSPLVADKYPAYIYNVSWDKNNPRGRRTVELLDKDDSITLDEAIQYTLDIHDRLAVRWQNELKGAVAESGEKYKSDAEFQRAVRTILDWDGTYSTDATATVLLKYWRLKCGKSIDLSPIGQSMPLPAAARSQSLELLQQTMAELKERYGRWDIAWGQVHVVGRGGKYYPAPGADYDSGDKEGNFSETLMDVRSVESKEKPGVQIANSGSMAMILMFFDKDGVRSFTCTPWGQSAHPESKHYVDQAEGLYSKRTMKSTWWELSELEKHLESSKRLTYSP